MTFQVLCLSNHVRLEDCSFAGWGNHDCSDSENVILDCSEYDCVLSCFSHHLESIRSNEKTNENLQTINHLLQYLIQQPHNGEARILKTT